jgi:hypothetical protein
MVNRQKRTGRGAQLKVAIRTTINEGLSDRVNRKTGSPLYRTQMTDCDAGVVQRYFH